MGETYISQQYETTRKGKWISLSQIVAYAAIHSLSDPPRTLHPFLRQ
jgi:hypothetical protein